MKKAMASNAAVFKNISSPLTPLGIETGSVAADKALFAFGITIQQIGVQPLSLVEQN